MIPAIMSIALLTKLALRLGGPEENTQMGVATPD